MSIPQKPQRFAPILIPESTFPPKIPQPSHMSQQLKSWTLDEVVENI